MNHVTYWDVRYIFPKQLKSFYLADDNITEKKNLWDWLLWEPRAGSYPEKYLNIHGVQIR